MRVIALEYHDVVAGADWDASGFHGPSAATYKMPAAAFQQHLDAVRDAGVDVRNAVSDAAGGPAGTARVLWTFDDGGDAFVARTADMLEARGWRGHVFMTTGQLGRPGFLAGSDLRDLQGRGHVIGSHSRTHPTRFSALRPDEMEAEWRDSIRDLEDVLGAPVRCASVPGGFYAPLAARLAGRHGIRWLFTSEPVTRVTQVGECSVIGRFTLRIGHPASYVVRLVSPSPVARSGQWLHWNAKKVAKVVTGGLYGRVRERLVAP